MIRPEMIPRRHGRLKQLLLLVALLLLARPSKAQVSAISAFDIDFRLNSIGSTDSTAALLFKGVSKPQFKHARHPFPTDKCTATPYKTPLGQNFFCMWVGSFRCNRLDAGMQCSAACNSKGMSITGTTARPFDDSMIEFQNNKIIEFKII